MHKGVLSIISMRYFTTKGICSLVNLFLIKFGKDKKTQDIHNLEWNNFNGNLDFNQKKLLFSNKFTDVTLVSDDKIAFKARKFVLGACSPVLRELLIENFHPQPLKLEKIILMLARNTV